MEIREYKTYCHDEIVNLYKSVGWKNYLERENVLMQAYLNSLCVLGAYDGERLIGIVRAVGDGKTVVFVQDLLVLAEYQRKGVGTRLMKALMERFGDVYQMEWTNMFTSAIKTVPKRLSVPTPKLSTTPAKDL